MRADLVKIAAKSKKRLDKAIMDTLQKDGKVTTDMPLI